jgi:hypothetical protein
MPVRKYRSVADVPSSAVMDDRGPAAALRMACSLSEFALRLAASRRAPGVYKCHSLQEAQGLRRHVGP